MGPLATAALISGGATLVGNLPSIIPSKYEREQNKRLKELERRQEMGLLGLTERQEQQMQTQFRNTRDQAQRRQDAEMRRLSTPTAQPGQQIQIKAPDGRVVTVAIPAGLQPGQQFQVKV